MKKVTAAETFQALAKMTSDSLLGHMDETWEALSKDLLKVTRERLGAKSKELGNLHSRYCNALGDHDLQEFIDQQSLEGELEGLEALIGSIEDMISSLDRLQTPLEET